MALSWCQWLALTLPFGKQAFLNELSSWAPVSDSCSDQGPPRSYMGCTLSYVVPDWTLLPRPVSAGICAILGCHLPPAPGGSLLPLLGSFSDFQVIVRVRKQLCSVQPSSVPTVLLSSSRHPCLSVLFVAHIDGTSHRASLAHPSVHRASESCSWNRLLSNCITFQPLFLLPVPIAQARDLRAECLAPSSQPPTTPTSH